MKILQNNTFLAIFHSTSTSPLYYSLSTSLLDDQNQQIRQEEPLTVVDWNGYRYYDTDGPGTYAYGYDIEDPETTNIQFRNEERFSNGTVIGSYGYVTPERKIFVVDYIADDLGYRILSMQENSLDSLKS